MGFTQGASSPCSYLNPSRGIKAVVHGDDFLVEGVLSDLQWFEAEVRKELLIKAK